MATPEAQHPTDTVFDLHEGKHAESLHLHNTPEQEGASQDYYSHVDKSQEEPSPESKFEAGGVFTPRELATLYGHSAQKRLRGEFINKIIAEYNSKESDYILIRNELTGRGAKVQVINRDGNEGFDEFAYLGEIPVAGKSKIPAQRIPERAPVTESTGQNVIESVLAHAQEEQIDLLAVPEVPYLEAAKLMAVCKGLPRQNIYPARYAQNLSHRLKILRQQGLVKSSDEQIAHNTPIPSTELIKVLMTAKDSRYTDLLRQQPEYVEATIAQLHPTQEANEPHEREVGE